MKSLKERFEDNFVSGMENECWNWLGCLSSTGYGRIGMPGRHGRMIKAHRLAWEIYRRPIPPGIYVLHSCDNKKCVNPNHLFLGTPYDNMADKVAKGRQSRGEKHSQSKLTMIDIISIRKSNLHHSKLGKLFGVCRSHISKIKRGEVWK